MTKYSGKAFSGQRVVSDGNSYEGCTFTNCMIVYEGGGAPSFQDCKFETPQFSFDGAAGNTVTYLRALCRDPGMAPVVMDLLPELFQRRR